MGPFFFYAPLFGLSYVKNGNSIQRRQRDQEAEWCTCRLLLLQWNAATTSNINIEQQHQHCRQQPQQRTALQAKRGYAFSLRYPTLESATAMRECRPQVYKSLYLFQRCSLPLWLILLNRTRTENNLCRSWRVRFFTLSP